MEIKAIKTRKFLPPKDDLWALLLENITSLDENSILAITSKIVGISEGRCIPIKKVQNRDNQVIKGKQVIKDNLVIKEADLYLPRSIVPKGWVMHTIKNNLLVPSAGIDESNGNGFYIFWPKNPQNSAKKIWQYLIKTYKVSNIGVIITDSLCIPMRRGLVGISIAYYGFRPLRDYRGKKDIFGRKLNISLTDIPDCLASAAVLEMGEGSEQTPLAIISDIPYVRFTTKPYILKKPYSSFIIPKKEDLFYPFISAVSWKKGGSGKTR